MDSRRKPSWTLSHLINLENAGINDSRNADDVVIRSRYVENILFPPPSFFHPFCPFVFLFAQNLAVFPSRIPALGNPRQFLCQYYTSAIHTAHACTLRICNSEPSMIRIIRDKGPARVTSLILFPRLQGDLRKAIRGDTSDFIADSR